MKPETIYVAVQSAPPVVNVETPPPTVEAQSEWPAFAIGFATVVLLAFQLRIMSKQGATMNRQTDLLNTQTRLLDQQATIQRTDAIGTFYRIAHDIVEEMRKANVLPGTRILANFETHPRQMLRETSRLFAPLGNDFVLAATGTAVSLERYFEAVDEYNRGPESSDGAERWEVVQMIRGTVGRNLDSTVMHLAPEQRWRYREGSEQSFAPLCVMPLQLVTQIGYSEEDWRLWQK